MYELGTVIWVALLLGLGAGVVLLLVAVRRIWRYRQNKSTLPRPNAFDTVGHSALVQERALLTTDLLRATETLPQHEIELVHHALWMAMLLETSADGSIDHREIGFVADVFSQITGRSTSIQFVIEAAEDVQTRPQYALQEVSKARDLSLESKQYILTGAFLVSLTDRNLASGESDCLGDIADALGMDQEERKSLYAAIMKRLGAE